MEREKLAESKAMIIVVVLLIMVLLLLPFASACSSEQNGCKNCILDRLNCDCPGCKPVLRCLASCMWSGTPQAKCVRTCESREVKPCLADCKRCMQQCKCSCLAWGEGITWAYLNMYLLCIPVSVFLSSYTRISENGNHLPSVSSCLCSDSFDIIFRRAILFSSTAIAKC